MRTLGDEVGITVAALAGGVTSSTATTVSFARLAREHPPAAPLLAGGILIAGVTMLARVLVIAGALNPGLIAGLALPLAAAGLALLAASTMLILRRRTLDAPRPALELKNPFELATALKLAALIAVIMVAAKVLSAVAGTSGVFLLAAASGVVDVDALTLSMARLASSQIATGDAITAILLAASVNTAAKAAMAAYLGGRKIGRIVASASALAVIAPGGDIRRTGRPAFVGNRSGHVFDWRVRGGGCLARAVYLDCTAASRSAAAGRGSRASAGAVLKARRSLRQMARTTSRPMAATIGTPGTPAHCPTM